MIETPTSAITVSAPEESFNDTDDSAKEHLLETGPAITLVAQKPLTSGVRVTLRHLKAEAGRFSPWRGVLNFLLYQILFTIVANIFIAPFQSSAIRPVFVILASAGTGVLLALIHAAWTHKVVGVPTDTWFWQRMLPRSAWKHLALPAAVAASAEYVTVYIVQVAVYIFKLNQPEKHSKTSAVFSTISIVALFFLASLFIIMPAHVTLTRVEASLLPEDQDTIVPFDRTFAGKVVSFMAGGSGCIGFADAWKSFDWEARRRLVKLYLKGVAISFVVIIAFVHLILLEVWLVLGAAFIKWQANQEAMKGAHAQYKSGN
jgi:hypothetical protein